VYLPTIGCGRVIWHLGYTSAKSVNAFAASYGEFKGAALAIDRSYRALGRLTDGFNSTVKSLQRLFPTAKLAFCMLHATFKLPAHIKGVTKTGSQTLSEQFRGIFFVNRARKTADHHSLGQRLRRFVQEVTHLAGEDNGQRVRRWIERKKAGWHGMFENANIPLPTTLIDQIHNTIVPTAGDKRGKMCDTGGRGKGADQGLVSKSPNPYQWRVPMTLPLNSMECAIL